MAGRSVRVVSHGPSWTMRCRVSAVRRWCSSCCCCCCCCCCWWADAAPAGCRPADLSPSRKSFVERARTCKRLKRCLHIALRARTTTELCRPALGTPLQSGDEGLAVPDNRGLERWRPTCVHWILAWRRQSDAHRTERHGGDSWQRQRLRQALHRNPSRSYGASPAIWDHTVLPGRHPIHMNAPYLNLSHESRYLIYPPRRDGRLSWPGKLRYVSRRIQSVDGAISRKFSPSLTIH